MKSILFLGSKAIGYECLRYLLTERVRLQCEVVGVLTAANNALDHPTHNMEQLCWQQQIPIYPDVDTMLGFPPVDFIISVQYHKILRPKHIAKALQLAVNLHMAPLPNCAAAISFLLPLPNNTAISALPSTAWKLLLMAVLFYLKGVFRFPTTAGFMICINSL
ncbi:MAG: hypothetical protein IPL35_05440 [Sphingobacteriales bacterium]|nr:hypothetical protein [Sphingobacteriales bacterium]